MVTKDKHSYFLLYLFCKMWHLKYNSEWICKSVLIDFSMTFKFNPARCLFCCCSLWSRITFSGDHFRETGHFNKTVRFCYDNGAFSLQYRQWLSDNNSYNFNMNGTCKKKKIFQRSFRSLLMSSVIADVSFCIYIILCLYVISIPLWPLLSAMPFQFHSAYPQHLQLFHPQYCYLVYINMQLRITYLQRYTYDVTV